MIENLSDSSKLAAFKELKNSVYRNLYALADLEKYGCFNKEYEFVYSHDSKGINWVVMKHADSAQVVIFNNAEIDGLCGTLASTKLLFCDPVTLEIMKPHLSIASVECGFVSCLSKEHEIVQLSDCKMAISDRYSDISALICTDDVMGRINDPVELARSFEERTNINFGHNFILQDGKRIISHVASYAEAESYAVLSGVITDPAYRGRG